MEFAALLLEKAMQEDQQELLIQWGQEIFRWIKRSVCACVYVCAHLGNCLVAWLKCVFFFYQPRWKFDVAKEALWEIGERSGEVNDIHHPVL